MKSKLFNRTGSNIVINENTDDEDPKIVVVEFRLKEFLMKRGIKQKELAQMAGIRPNVVTNICRNYSERLSIEHVGKIATALGITDIREIMTLVEYSEAEWHNMYNSHHPEEDEE